MVDFNLDKIISKALIHAKVWGIVTDELKILYLAENRRLVPWHMFPIWAQPNLQMDNVIHEG